MVKVHNPIPADMKRPPAPPAPPQTTELRRLTVGEMVKIMTIEAVEKAMKEFEFRLKDEEETNDQWCLSQLNRYKNKIIKVVNEQ